MLFWDLATKRISHTHTLPSSVVSIQELGPNVVLIEGKTCGVHIIDTTLYTVVKHIPTDSHGFCKMVVGEHYFVGTYEEDGLGVWDKHTLELVRVWTPTNEDKLGLCMCLCIEEGRVLALFESKDVLVFDLGTLRQSSFEVWKVSTIVKY